MASPPRPLLLLLLLLACSLPAPAAPMIAIAPCDGSDAQSFNVSGGRVSSAGVPGQCLATADCAPAKLGDVGLAPCGEARCGPGAPDEAWSYDAASGQLRSGANPGAGLCLTLAQDGPSANLWSCGAQSNGVWDAVPVAGRAGLVALRSRDA